MDKAIESVAERITESLLKSRIIDKHTVCMSIAIALTALKPTINKEDEKQAHRDLLNKLHIRKVQAKRDSIEKEFWKGIAKTYIGEDNIQPYYDRLNQQTKEITP